jgi:hypothetical protein
VGDWHLFALTRVAVGINTAFGCALRERIEVILTTAAAILLFYWQADWMESR